MNSLACSIMAMLAQVPPLVVLATVHDGAASHVVDASLGTHDATPSRNAGTSLLMMTLR
jgi:hypothetical protein